MAPRPRLAQGAYAVSVALSILLGVLYVALGLVALALLMPFHLDARGWIEDGDGAGRAQVRWGGWLVVFRADTESGITLRLLGIRVWRLGERRRDPRKAAKKQAKRETQRQKKREEGRGARRGGVFRHRHALLRTLGAIWRAIPVRGHLYGAIGLSDPGDTAAVFAAIEPFNRSGRGVDFDLEPDWVESTVALDGALTLRLWPIHILLALLWLVVRDGPTRRGLWALARR